MQGVIKIMMCDRCQKYTLSDNLTFNEVCGFICLKCLKHWVKYEEY